MLSAELDHSARSKVTPALFGYSATALLLPVLAAVGDPPGGLVWAIPAAVLASVGGAVVVGGRGRGAVSAWIGGALVFAAAWLIPQTGQPWVICVLGLIIGIGFGLAAPATSGLRDAWAIAFGLL